MYIEAYGQDDSGNYSGLTQYVYSDDNITYQENYEFDNYGGLFFQPSSDIIEQVNIFFNNFYLRFKMVTSIAQMAPLLLKLG